MQLVAGCLWVTKEEIRILISVGHTHVNDFDWRLKMSLDDSYASFCKLKDVGIMKI